MEALYQTLQNLGYTHPIHPTIVYLPIGGVMAALIFGIIAVIFNRHSFVCLRKAQQRSGIFCRFSHHSFGVYGLAVLSRRYLDVSHPNYSEEA